MFKFCNLYSGSSGNCSLIMTENSKILIDCGVTNKKLVEGLASLNISPKDIDAVLITHEHSDHIQGLKTLCKNANIDVYANHHTMDAINQPIDDGVKKFFVTNEKFELNDLKITPFAIPHDAADPVHSFLVHLNDFDLEEFMRQIHFQDLKVPTLPFQLPGSRDYYGIEEMKQAELDFLKTTVTARSLEDVYFYSDMPMMEMAADEAFKKKWMYGMAMMLRKGLHLHIVHDVHRHGLLLVDVCIEAEGSVGGLDVQLVGAGNRHL